MRADEADRLRAIRLASLRADPQAFGATYESDAARPPSWWEQGAQRSDDGREQRMFVVVDDEDRWLGLALVRADDETPGDAVLNAMWVAPEARGQGASRALCEACAEWASEHGFAHLNAAIVVGNERRPAGVRDGGLRRVAPHDVDRPRPHAGGADPQATAARGTVSCATIACTRMFSAATVIPTTPAMSRTLVPASRIAKIGRSRGSSRAAARA